MRSGPRKIVTPQECMNDLLAARDIEYPMFVGWLGLGNARHVPPLAARSTFVNNSVHNRTMTCNETPHSL
jgi:hypothetical protein